MSIKIEDIVRGRLPLFNVLIAIVLIAIVTGLINPKFWELGNWQALLTWYLGLSVLAMGESMVLISGGIDLSVGSLASFSSMLLAIAVDRLGWSLQLSIIFVITVAVFIGLFHGAFVSIFSPPLPQIMPAFIITLADNIFFGGLATALTLGWPIPLYKYPDLMLIATPWMLASILLIVALVSIYVQRYSIIGRYIYAVGGNIEVSRLSGVPINRVRLFVYSYSAMCASIAGIIFTALMMTGYPGVGRGQELYAIASNAIGGVSLAGGEGNAVGAAVGAFLITLIRNALVLSGVSPYWYDPVTGVILGVAVAVDLYRRSRGAR
ncbi:ABC transporter permease [Ignisphaera sp. 4213-co]|uniref:ABC transporter permease n=1 Tax=Ignisphaera cupida TaxID=3050454 RepID=A0ABD4Z7Q7_9CREN|nr:ABC transporter permease [Ignisphaera sp. 4213-co]MDK6028148.1 ABC transporter permease [Ignisphaera sp. 4213-co]